MEPPVIVDTSPDYFQFAAQQYPTGFPFEDDTMSRGRQDIRSHLDDLAQRHPEFADHLRCPPWAGEMGGAHTWGRKRRGSGSGDDDARSQASGASSSSSEHQEQGEEPGPLRGRSRQGNIPQHGLRNTVDLGQQQHESEQEKQGRGQRSMSAPPDNRSQQPQRYVSRIEINPVNPADPASVAGPGTVTSESHGKPPVAPKQPQPQPQPATSTKQAHTGNVRHIPIFVEGRDEPILPRNVGPENVERVFSSQVPQPGAEQAFPPQESPHGFGRPPQFASQRQFYPQHQPPEGGRNFQQPSSPKQQQQPEAPAASDAISRVQTIQKDVEELQAQVNKFSGLSRRDKEYVYLDEMLTRNLLKLDDIVTEGRHDVRQARKEAIRTIQGCISLLEGKVPVPEENKEAAMDIGEACQPCEASEGTATEETPAEGAMEVVPAEDDRVSRAVTAKPLEQQISEGAEVKSGEVSELVPAEVGEQEPRAGEGGEKVASVAEDEAGEVPAPENTDSKAPPQPQVENSS
ncbi:BAG domain-containing protein Samui isoform X2 [Zootermopsis nevadensis]|uniref:BAG domain-containing protein Samui isoform X2 n=1 Tax=Zootermopsis nevadensis TaxID=136037 RepID=UPI000B8E8694|nr:BAG domain-containing protein Samui isoform X2 [Zootermopsis nevadensis]